MQTGGHSQSRMAMVTASGHSCPPGTCWALESGGIAAISLTMVLSLFMFFSELCKI